jgi:probable phosphoglycerate mutase
VTVLLARHGEVEGISPERFRGRTDVELTERGLQQATALARAVVAAGTPSAIYASPLRRCIATAAKISELCGLESKVAECLTDIDYGEWQWQTVEELSRRDPDALARWYSAPDEVRFPGGESLQDVGVRAADALRLMRSFFPGNRVVFVTHDTVIRVLLLYALSAPLASYWKLAQAPCALNELVLTEMGTRLERMNDTEHLNSLAD